MCVWEREIEGDKQRSCERALSGRNSEVWVLTLNIHIFISFFFFYLIFAKCFLSLSIDATVPIGAAFHSAIWSFSWLWLLVLLIFVLLFLFLIFVVVILCAIHFVSCIPFFQSYINIANWKWVHFIVWRRFKLWKYMEIASWMWKQRKKPKHPRNSRELHTYGIGIAYFNQRIPI